MINCGVRVSSIKQHSITISLQLQDLKSDNNGLVASICKFINDHNPYFARYMLHIMHCVSIYPVL